MNDEELLKKIRDNKKILTKSGTHNEIRKFVDNELGSRGREIIEQNLK